MRILAILLCSFASLASPAALATKPGFFDWLTLAGLPRAGMTCAAYLAASTSRVPADGAMGPSPVEAARRREALHALEWFAGDLVNRTRGLGEIVPNEATMSIASANASAEDTAHVLGRIASATAHALHPEEDERIVAFRLRGLGAIREFDDERLRELASYLRLSWSPMVEQAKRASLIGYAAPFAAFAEALWNVASGTPFAELAPFAAIPLFVPLHYFVTDRRHPEALGAYLAFRDGDVSGPAWHFESTSAALPGALVASLLDPMSAHPNAGEVVDGQRLLRALLGDRVREATFSNRLWSESWVGAYALARLVEWFGRERRSVSVDRLLVYDNRGVEGARWELTVLLRIGQRPPRPPAPSRTQRELVPPTPLPAGNLMVAPIPVRSR